MKSENLQQEIIKEAKIELARRSLFEFMKYLFTYEVVWNWHHEYVCNTLQDFVEGKHPFMMVFMPPQHQKSTMMTEFLPAWNFGRDPNSQTLLVMYNSSQAEKYNRKIQRIMDTEKYLEIFPETKLNSKNTVTDRRENYVRNSREFEIVNQRGFFKSVGVGGGIAGNPAKLALMDDVIKNVAEASSETYRNKTYEWFTDELEARLHNDSKVGFTITRRHEDDLAGRLLKRDGLIEDGGKWKVVTLAAIKEDHNDPNDPRKIGEALFPSLHSLERLEYIKLKNNRTFEGLYQQRPTAKGGNIIKPEWFRKVQKSALPFNIDEKRAKFVIDGAFTDNTYNDETATLSYFMHKGIMYVNFCDGIRLELNEYLKHFNNHYDVWNGKANSEVYIEKKASGHPIGSMLSSYEYGNRNVHYIANKWVSLGKMGRVETATAIMGADKIVLIEGSWNESFLNQLASFPNGKHDDKVDVIAYAVIIEFIAELTRGGTRYGEY